ncbi:P-loop containing nucleoside triphosphate hydrolase protein [Trametes polyzona]|nr:P-loop containing nucleoside triphosphate hydrolase protein [Trametes polyzona]
MAASLWSKTCALLPAARICRCSQSALASHALRAGRFTSARHAHAAPASWQKGTRQRNTRPRDPDWQLPLDAEPKGEAGEATPSPHADQPRFDSLEDVISRPLLKALTQGPFTLTHMSPVQAAVLPLLPKLLQPFDADETKGPRDLLVKARTGTGKTLAFLIPAVEARLRRLKEHGEHVAQNIGLKDLGNRTVVNRGIERFAREHVGPIIISPTRELATQIANEAIKLTRHLDRFEVRLMVGGLSKRQQLREWHTGRRDILVATPGRLRDFLENEPNFADEIKASDMLILDEADTLLDMGFREDISAIIEQLKPSPQRQTFMFSATVSKAIQQVARQALAKNHEFINCVPVDAVPTHMSIPQYYTALPSADQQVETILHLIAQDQLQNAGKSKVLIFLPTTELVKLYSTIISTAGPGVLPAGRRTRFGEIHSKMSMAARMNVSKWYRTETSGSSVLITSDVSARGVDYPGVTRVIQIGIPKDGDVYVHRVGRTGRGSNTTGRADLVLMPWELGFLTWQLQDIPLKELTVNQLKEQVYELARQHDENPDAPSHGGNSRLPDKVLPQLEAARDEIASVQEELDPADVRRSLMSALAYYMGAHAQLRVQRNVVGRGVSQWATALSGQEMTLTLPNEFKGRTGKSRGGDRAYADRSSGKRYPTHDRRDRVRRPRDEDDYVPRERRSFGKRDEDGERPRYTNDRRSSDYPRRRFDDDDFEGRPSRPSFSRDRSFGGDFDRPRRDRDGEDGEGRSFRPSFSRGGSRSEGGGFSRGRRDDFPERD